MLNHPLTNTVFRATYIAAAICLILYGIASIHSAKNAGIDGTPEVIRVYCIPGHDTNVVEGDAVYWYCRGCKRHHLTSATLEPWPATP